MAKYRKKPVEIEAVQLRWDTWCEICDFVGVGKLADGKPQGCYVLADGSTTDVTTRATPRFSDFTFRCSKG